MPLISLGEYAKMHHKNPVSTRQKAQRGGFKTTIKIGHYWVIDSEEPYGRTRIIKPGK